MSATGALQCFAYGEHLEGLAQRSLGYRLLAPAQPQPWAAEVEALARRLQTAPYPDHWPPTDLFCSVLLADGHRLVAAARYGLADHTSSHRRGGLEMIGVVGPAALDVSSAFSIYRWLRKRRAGVEDLHALGGTAALDEVLAAVPPEQAPADPVPVLPVRLWQEGALLFAATTPSEPDHRTNLLEQGAGGTWQWLPLVGADFPLQTYAQRGPLVAWTPHLAGVALKLERKPADEHARPPKRRRLLNTAAAVLLALLVAVMSANLWATLAVRNRLAAAREDAQAGALQGSPQVQPSEKPRNPPDVPEESREAFANALYALLTERGGQPEWEQLHDQLLTRYERAARDHKALRLKEADVKGREAVGAVVLLSERSARRIEETIRHALLNRGWDREVVNAACQRVREKLVEEAKKEP
jgi:hypothetical protein